MGSLSNQKGFSMLEIVISLAISMIVLIAVVGTNIMVQKNNEAMHERVIALQDAHQVVERIREAASSGLFPNNVYAAFPGGQPVAGFQNLTNEQVLIQYNPAGAAGSSDLVDVTVTVSWIDENRRNSLYTLSTLLAQRE